MTAVTTVVWSVLYPSVVAEEVSAAVWSEEITGIGVFVSPDCTTVEVGGSVSVVDASVAIAGDSVDGSSFETNVVAIVAATAGPSVAISLSGFLAGITQQEPKRILSPQTPSDVPFNSMQSRVNMQTPVRPLVLFRQMSGRMVIKSPKVGESGRQIKSSKTTTTTATTTKSKK